MADLVETTLAASAAQDAAAPVQPAVVDRGSFLKAGAATAAAAALSPLLGGAAAQAAAPSVRVADKVQLSYWTGWTGYEFDELQKLIDKFNAAHPAINVKMTTVSGQYEKVLTAIAAGNPPDVVSAVWEHQLASIADRGGLLPLDAYAKNAGYKAEDFAPAIWRMTHYKGKLWGLATTFDSQFIIYRKDIFRKVGLDPAKPPQTLAELTHAIDVTTAVDSKGNLTRLGYDPGDLYWWGLVFGGSFYDEKNHKVTANDPKIVAALDWMGQLAKKVNYNKVSSLRSGFGQYLSPDNAFFVGKIAMDTVGEWFVAIAKRYAPNLDYGCFPAPPPPGGRTNTTNFDGSIFTIPAGVKNPAASWEFIKYICSPATSYAFCKAINNVSPFPAVSSKPEFSKNECFRLGIKLLNGPNSFGPVQMPVFSQYIDELTKAVSFVKHGQKSAKQALDDVTKTVQHQLDLQMRR